MEYRNTHQARFSKDYRLVIGEDELGSWKLLVNGLCPIRCSLLSFCLSDAQAEAYSFADQYFVEKGIVDPRVPREKTVWVAHP